MQYVSVSWIQHSQFFFIIDRNLAKANCIGNRVCTSCDIVILESNKTSNHSRWIFSMLPVIKKKSLQHLQEIKENKEYMAQMQIE